MPVHASAYWLPAWCFLALALEQVRRGLCWLLLTTTMTAPAATTTTTTKTTTTTTTATTTTTMVTETATIVRPENPDPVSSPLSKLVADKKASCFASPWHLVFVASAVLVYRQHGQALLEHGGLTGQFVRLGFGLLQASDIGPGTIPQRDGTRETQPCPPYGNGMQLSGRALGLSIEL